MILPRSKNARVLCANTDDAAALIEAVADPSWASGATLLKSDSGTSTFAGEALGQRVTVKAMRMNRVKDLFSALAGRTRLMRQWNGSALLRGAGVDTPECLALVRSGRTETLVLEHEAGESLFDLLMRNDEPVAGRIMIARSLARTLAAMRRAGLYNRDNKPSNVIISPDRARASIIDTVGVRRDEDTSCEHRMLAALCIEPMLLAAPLSRTDRMRVLVALHRGDDPSPKKRARWRKTRRHVWETVEELVDEHGDPTGERVGA